MRELELIQDEEVRVSTCSLAILERGILLLFKSSCAVRDQDIKGKA
jgi:sulfur relay (sulfurtransferase) complex TusBCD TusD component (DsrE family)